MSKARDLTPDEKRLMGDAAALIRTHLWLGETPDPPHPNGKPWTMARDLSIWKRLLFCGYSGEDINAAIPRVRDVIHQDVPLRMTTLYNGKYGTPVLEQCIGAAHKARPDQSRGPHAGTTLPKAMWDILDGMRPK